MSDWKETKRIVDAARAAERDAADLLRREGFPDPMTRWRNDADERAAAEKWETRRRQAKTRRDQREREDRRAMIEAMVAAEVNARIDARIAEVYDNIAEAIDRLSKGVFDKLVTKKELSELQAQLAHVETLLRSEPRERADLPLLHRRAAN